MASHDTSRTMMGRWLSIVMAAALALAAIPAAATDYYVAPTGDDDDPGTLSEPWCTVQKAASTLAPGDTVHVMTGVYPEHVQVLVDGTAAQPITFQARAGHEPVIDGSSVVLGTWGGLLEIVGRSHIVVRGLRVVNAGPHDNDAGILVDWSSHVTIDGCSTWNTTSSGIGVWDSTDVVLTGNEVELACNDGEQECITVAGTASFEVRDNHVFNGGPGSIGGEGIDVKDGSADGVVSGNHVHHLSRLGIYVDAWDEYTGNVQVFGNRVHDCSGSGFAVAAEAGGLLENVFIFNNIAHDNATMGITVGGWGEPVPSHPISNVKIVNNTLVGNGTGAWGGGILVENPDADGIVVRNNITSQNLSFQIQVEAVGTGLVVDHNLIDGFRGDTYEIRGTAYREGEPGFRDAAALDFHLVPGALAVDGGSAVDAPVVDFDGASRPTGPRIDMGAFELAATIFSDGFEDENTNAWSGTVG